MIEHADMIEDLNASQKADHDLREKVREAHLFCDKRDGQWEPYWWSANEGKPRYTFDLTNPIVDQIAGEMEQADFDINIKPAGGNATKDVALTYDGLIRNIENISNATEVFNEAGRSMVTGGMDGWRVVQRFVDDNSFDQDLMIEPIANFVDRVWFDQSAEKRDKSDARFAFVMQGVTLKEYKERWPKGSQQSVSQDRWNQAYWNQPDLIMVGEYYHFVEIDRELVLMSNGATYEADEDFEKVKDELAAVGVTELKRRTRKKRTVHVRKFDAGDWLEDDKETVFSYIPVIPTYGNFKVFENKTIYWGAVEKLIDSQRVLNYSLSREIEEGALAPRAKYWGTPEQRAGHEDTISTLNTNNDPWQDYNHVDGQMPPQQQGGAQINPGLRMISESMNQMITQSAGLFAANMGDNPNAQSGVAIKALQNKGDTGTIKYFAAQECAICHTARILVDAIPKVYEGERQVRLLKEDGSYDMATLNQKVVDQQTQEVVVLNDLSVGTYDVTCSAGPAFQNKQQETVAALTEIAAVDPTVIELGGDILLNNVVAPGMTQMAERKRQQLFQAGAIPVEQMTDEEKAQMQQMQNQPQQPTEGELLAMAEQSKADAQHDKNQIQLMKERAELSLKEQRLELERSTLDMKAMKEQLTMLQENQKGEQSAQQQQFEQFMALQQQQAADMKSAVDNLNTQANTLKTLREAIGADTVVGPDNMAAYARQAGIVQDEQDRQ